MKKNLIMKARTAIMITVYIIYSISLLISLVFSWGLLSILTLEIKTSKSHFWKLLVGLFFFLSIISCEVFSRFLSTYLSIFSSSLSSFVKLCNIKSFYKSVFPFFQFSFLFFWWFFYLFFHSWLVCWSFLLSLLSQIYH